MIPSSHIIKKTAKSQLKNHWISSILVAVVFLLVVCFFWILFGFMMPFFVSNKNPEIVSVIFSAAYSILFFCAVMPLFQGVLRWYWFLGLEKKLSISEIFYYFSEGGLFFKSLFLYVTLLGRVVLVALVSLVPAAVVRLLPVALGHFFQTIEANGMLFYFASVVLMVVGLAVALVVVMKYFAAPLMLVINEELVPEEALKIAVDLHLSRGSCLFFVVSFVGWMVLSLVGVPLIYALPYFLMSYTVAVRFAVTNHRYDMSRWGLPPLI